MSLFTRNQSATVRAEYRVGHGGGVDYYAVDLVPQGNGKYKLHVRLFPPDRHGKGAAHNHLLAGNIICVASGREPTSIASAKKIAKVWCECWSTYCRTGRFPGS